MRIGTNPEKKKSKKLEYKLHRIIVPVFIPETSHEYYKEAVVVFKTCINSLLKTVDLEKTAITIINNNSNHEVDVVIEYFYQKKLIDKYIRNSENKGKVYSILQEARASYEEYITIADADVFFFNNWQPAVYEVFRAFSNVGVVGLTPDPHMAFYCNNSLWFCSFLSIKRGNVVATEELELFEKGINKKDFFVTKKYNWKKKQYFLEKDKTKVIVGASHFASTYRKSMFEKLPFKRPLHVFPGGELNFLDTPIDKLGYHRVSLNKAFVYHMGNTISPNNDLEGLKNIELIGDIAFKHKVPLNFIPFIIKVYFVRIIRKLNFF